mmetsp:Transcript_15173/g.40048  ORF Transcript_15173/g.40048 Transcript_15173/m.40048 type:complete len:231 (-) Transcript_15173:3-695(-)
MTGLVRLVLADGQHLRGLLDGGRHIAPGELHLRNGVHCRRSVRRDRQRLPSHAERGLGVAALQVYLGHHAHGLNLPVFVPSLLVERLGLAKNSHGLAPAAFPVQMNLSKQQHLSRLFGFVLEDTSSLLRQLSRLLMLLLGQMDVNEHPDGICLALAVASPHRSCPCITQQTANLLRLRQAILLQNFLGLLQRVFRRSHRHLSLISKARRRAPPARQGENPPQGEDGPELA